MGRTAERGAPEPAAGSLRPVVSPAPSASARRRIAGAPQDTALYSCACGFQFEAPVSTSVGCPHCGDTQAW